MEAIVKILSSDIGSMPLRISKDIIAAGSWKTDGLIPLIYPNDREYTSFRDEIVRTMIEKIYSGDVSAWPGGGGVAAFDLPERSPVRAAFTSALLGKSVAVMKAQWAVKLFSGRGTPPRVAGSDGEVKRAVAANKNAIGYIKASSVDGSVKTVLTLR